MIKFEDILHASKILISVAVAAGADTATAGVASIVGGGFSVLALIKNLGDKSTDLEQKIAGQLERALSKKNHLSKSSRLLIPQMIAAAAPSLKRSLTRGAILSGFAGRCWWNLMTRPTRHRKLKATSFGWCRRYSSHFWPMQTSATCCALPLRRRC